MVVAWQRFDAIPDSAPFGWLCGVAARVALNDERGQRRRGRLVERVISAQGRTPLLRQLDSNDLLDEQRSALQAAFDRLDDDDQEVLRLVISDELSNQELALALDVHVAAARKRLSRARRRVRDNYVLLNKEQGTRRSPGEMGG
jgi:RNA polymerase sigma-70 factor (ECF subfamily)